jgi:hypothetical protein
MATKIKTTIFLDTQLIDTVKKIATIKGTTQTKIINQAVKEYIDKEPVKDEIPLEFIVKQDKTKNMDETIGIIKGHKDFDIVKAVREVRNGEYYL